jgi:hypothetical protein
MNIDQFYEADERRRQSAEVELGSEWRDAHGVRYELNWVEDTGELYVMREPVPPMWEDPFGGIYVEHGPRTSVEEMTVAVIAHIGTREELETVVRGWQSEMPAPNSIEWLVRTLQTRDRAKPSSS